MRLEFYVVLLLVKSRFSSLIGSSLRFFLKGMGFGDSLWRKKSEGSFLLIEIRAGLMSVGSLRFFLSIVNLATLIKCKDKLYR